MNRPIRDKFLVFGAPQVGEAEIEEVVDSLRSGWLGTGPKVARFEEMFRQYVGAKYAMAVNSCTAGLHLSMVVAGLNPGDEVITTPMTFCATVNSIIHAGATPVLVDCDRATMLIDPQRIEDAITPRTRAILPVHLCGRPCDMDAIMDIASRHHLLVIEDAAHAIETVYKAQKIGNIGHLTVFSFYVTKNVITGEGGMVTTNIPEFADKVKVFALHGMSKDAWKRFSDEGYKHYQVVECGFKYNMMDLQAAIGIHQLARVEQNWQKRKLIWNQYNAAFKDLPIATPGDTAPNTRHAYHLYTVLIDEQQTGVSRDAFLDRMTKHNIGVGVHYLSIPEHPYYQQTFGWKPEDYPHSMKIGRQSVSLPLSAKLTEQDQQDVITAVKVSLAKK